MGSSTYFGGQVASIPHLERGSEIVRDLRSDVDAAFVLLEAALGGIVGGLTTGSILIGAASLPAELVMKGVGNVLVGDAATASAVAIGTAGDFLVGDATSAVAVNLAVGEIFLGDGITAAKIDMGAVGAVLVGDAATATAITIGTAGDFLVGDATSAVAVNLGVGEIFIGNGTTAAKLDMGVVGGMLIGDAATATVIPLADTNIMIGDGTSAAAFSLSNDVTMTNAGVVTLAAKHTTKTDTWSDPVRDIAGSPHDIPCWVAPANCTITSVGVTCSNGLTGHVANIWSINIINKTQAGETLKLAAKQYTAGIDITAYTMDDLGLDQNLTDILTGDVLSFSLVGAAAAPNLEDLLVTINYTLV